MKKHLTRAAIDAATAKGKPYEIRDTSVGGLILRVQPSGTKSFVVEWARGRRTTIGRYPIMTAAMATTKALQLLAEVAEHGEPRAVAANPQTLGQYLDGLYYPHILATAKAGKATKAAIERQFSHLRTKRMDRITAAVFDKFRAQRMLAGRKPATVNRDLDRIKAALGQAVKWGILDKNPLAGVHRVARGIGKRVRYLSDAERAALDKALRAREAEAKAKRARFNDWRVQRHMEPLPAIFGYCDHFTPMVLLALNTGMRRGELTKVTWADVDFKAKVATVRAGYAKSGHERHIPLNRSALTVLRLWRRVHPAGRLFPVASVSTAWATLMKDAGIVDFRFHDCRHDFASRLAMADVSLNTIRELLGHGDLSMTLRYAHLAPAHKAAAVDLLG